MNIKYDNFLSKAMNYANVVILDGVLVKNRLLGPVGYGTERVLIVDTYARYSKFINFPDEIKKIIMENIDLSNKFEFVTER
jgi:hypothetical protein